MSLDDVTGYAHFAEFFSAYREHYVIIGGIATIFSLESAGMPGRPTKDIDLVVLANPNKPFADRLREFVVNGGYQIEADGASPRNYRFRRPALSEYPFQLEIFSTTPLEIDLREGQTIVPFSTSPGIKSLSAILMDYDYFKLVKTCVMQAGAVSLLTVDALIPLKARAFLDMHERKARGEKFDEKDIKKHRNDVLRLAGVLGDGTFELGSPKIAKDLVSFFEHPEIDGLAMSTLRTILSDSRAAMESVRQHVFDYFRLIARWCLAIRFHRQDRK